RQHDILYVDGGPSSTGTAGCLRMEGREVFRQAVTHLAAVVDEALTANGLTGADIDWLVPHQANTRIIEAVGDRRIRPGHLVLMEALGGGLTWGASVVRW